jgi:GYF domain 2
MANWFFASNGQQQGPYPEAQFRDLIARGAVTPQTLVWSEGMAGWQKAGEIPGLMSGGMAPPAMPPGGGPVMSGGGYGAPASYGGGSALAIDFGIWDFVWRSIVLLLGVIVVIPAPWAICWYTNWLVSCVQVPGRPNLSFTGKPMTIAIWYFGAIILAIILAVLASQTDNQAFNHVFNIVQLVLDWLLLRYVVANIASNGQPLGLSFSGSFWAFLGWNILVAISFITIIGWAWVFAAEIRWICRNIQGTRRAVTFRGTGLEFLWRVLVALIASVFIIPIPWVYRWMMQWQLSQTELVDRGAYAA